MNSGKRPLSMIKRTLGSKDGYILLVTIFVLTILIVFAFGIAVASSASISKTTESIVSEESTYLARSLAAETAENLAKTNNIILNEIAVAAETYFNSTANEDSVLVDADGVPYMTDDFLENFTIDSGGVSWPLVSDVTLTDMGVGAKATVKITPKASKANFADMSDADARLYLIKYVMADQGISYDSAANRVDDMLIDGMTALQYLNTIYKGVAWSCNEIDITVNVYNRKGEVTGTSTYTVKRDTYARYSEVREAVEDFLSNYPIVLTEGKYRYMDDILGSHIVGLRADYDPPSKNYGLESNSTSLYAFGIKDDEFDFGAEQWLTTDDEGNKVLNVTEVMKEYNAVHEKNTTWIKIVSGVNRIYTSGNVGIDGGGLTFAGLNADEVYEYVKQKLNKTDEEMQRMLENANMSVYDLLKETNYTGSISAAGDISLRNLKFTGALKCNGSIFIYENVTLMSGEGSSGVNLVSAGNITIRGKEGSAPTVIDGDLCAAGSVSVANNCIVKGSIYSQNGFVEIGKDCVVEGSVYAPQSVTINGANAIVYGDLYTKGSLDFDRGENETISLTVGYDGNGKVQKIEDTCGDSCSARIPDSTMRYAELNVAGDMYLEDGSSLTIGGACSIKGNLHMKGGSIVFNSDQFVVGRDLVLGDLKYIKDKGRWEEIPRLADAPCETKGSKIEKSNGGGEFNLYVGGDMYVGALATNEVNKLNDANIYVTGNNGCKMTGFLQCLDLYVYSLTLAAEGTGSESYSFRSLFLRGYDVDSPALIEQKCGDYMGGYIQFIDLAGGKIDLIYGVLNNGQGMNFYVYDGVVQNIYGSNITLNKVTQQGASNPGLGLLAKNGIIPSSTGYKYVTNADYRLQTARDATDNPASIPSDSQYGLIVSYVDGLTSEGNKITCKNGCELSGDIICRELEALNSTFRFGSSVYARGNVLIESDCYKHTSLSCPEHLAYCDSNNADDAYPGPDIYGNGRVEVNCSCGVGNIRLTNNGEFRPGPGTIVYGDYTTDYEGITDINFNVTGMVIAYRGGLNITGNVATDFETSAIANTTDGKGNYIIRNGYNVLRENVPFTFGIFAEKSITIRGSASLRIGDPTVCDHDTRVGISTGERYSAYTSIYSNNDSVSIGSESTEMVIYGSIYSGGGTGNVIYAAVDGSIKSTGINTPLVYVRNSVDENVVLHSIYSCGASNIISATAAEGDVYLNSSEQHYLGASVKGNVQSGGSLETYAGHTFGSDATNTFVVTGGLTLNGDTAFRGKVNVYGDILSNKAGNEFYSDVRARSITLKGSVSDASSRTNSFHGEGSVIEAYDGNVEILNGTGSAHTGAIASKISAAKGSVHLFNTNCDGDILAGSGIYYNFAQISDSAPSEYNAALKLEGKCEEYAGNLDSAFYERVASFASYSDADIGINVANGVLQTSEGPILLSQVSCYGGVFATSVGGSADLLPDKVGIIAFASRLMKGTVKTNGCLVFAQSLLGYYNSALGGTAFVTDVYCSSVYDMEGQKKISSAEGIGVRYFEIDDDITFDCNVGFADNLNDDYNTTTAFVTANSVNLYSDAGARLNILGSVVARGNVTALRAANEVLLPADSGVSDFLITGDLYAGGNVTLGGGVRGNVRTGGSLSVAGTILGDVYVGVDPISGVSKTADLTIGSAEEGVVAKVNGAIVHSVGTDVNSIIQVKNGTFKIYGDVLGSIFANQNNEINTFNHVVAGSIFGSVVANGNLTLSGSDVHLGTYDPSYAQSTGAMMYKDLTVDCATYGYSLTQCPVCVEHAASADLSGIPNSNRNVFNISGTMKVSGNLHAFVTVTCSTMTLDGNTGTAVFVAGDTLIHGALTNKTEQYVRFYGNVQVIIGKQRGITLYGVDAHLTEEEINSLIFLGDDGKQGYKFGVSFFANSMMNGEFDAETKTLIHSSTEITSNIQYLGPKFTSADLDVENQVFNAIFSSANIKLKHCTVRNYIYTTGNVTLIHCQVRKKATDETVNENVITAKNIIIQGCGTNGAVSTSCNNSHVATKNPKGNTVPGTNQIYGCIHSSAATTVNGATLYGVNSGYTTSIDGANTHLIGNLLSSNNVTIGGGYYYGYIKSGGSVTCNGNNATYLYSSYEAERNTGIIAKGAVSLTVKSSAIIKKTYVNCDIYSEAGISLVNENKNKKLSNVGVGMPTATGYNDTFRNTAADNKIVSDIISGGSVQITGFLLGNVNIECETLMLEKCYSDGYYAPQFTATGSIANTITDCVFESKISSSATYASAMKTCIETNADLTIFSTTIHLNNIDKTNNEIDAIIKCGGAFKTKASLSGKLKFTNSTVKANVMYLENAIAGDPLNNTISYVGATLDSGKLTSKVSADTLILGPDVNFEVVEGDEVEISSEIVSGSTFGTESSTIIVKKSITIDRLLTINPTIYCSAARERAVAGKTLTEMPYVKMIINAAPNGPAETSPKPTFNSPVQCEAMEISGNSYPVFNSTVKVTTKAQDSDAGEDEGYLKVTNANPVFESSVYAAKVQISGSYAPYSPLYDANVIFKGDDNIFGYFDVVAENSWHLAVRGNVSIGTIHRAANLTFLDDLTVTGSNGVSSTCDLYQCTVKGDFVSTQAVSRYTGTGMVFEGDVFVKGDLKAQHIEGAVRVSEGNLTITAQETPTWGGGVTTTSNDRSVLVVGGSANITSESNGAENLYILGTLYASEGITLKCSDCYVNGDILAVGYGSVSFDAAGRNLNSINLKTLSATTAGSGISINCDDLNVLGGAASSTGAIYAENDISIKLSDGSTAVVKDKIYCSAAVTLRKTTTSASAVIGEGVRTATNTALTGGVYAIGSITSGLNMTVYGNVYATGNVNLNAATTVTATSASKTSTVHSDGILNFTAPLTAKYITADKIIGNVVQGCEILNAPTEINCGAAAVSANYITTDGNYTSGAITNGILMNVGGRIACSGGFTNNSTYGDLSGAVISATGSVTFGGLVKATTVTSSSSNVAMNAGFEGVGANNGLYAPNGTLDVYGTMKCNSAYSKDDMNYTVTGTDSVLQVATFMESQGAVNIKTAEGVTITPSIRATVGKIYGKTAVGIGYLGNGLKVTGYGGNAGNITTDGTLTSYATRLTVANLYCNILKLYGSETYVSSDKLTSSIAGGIFIGGGAGEYEYSVIGAHTYVTGAVQCSGNLIVLSDVSVGAHRPDGNGNPDCSGVTALLSGSELDTVGSYLNGGQLGHNVWVSGDMIFCEGFNVEGFVWVRKNCSGLVSYEGYNNGSNTYRYNRIWDGIYVRGKLSLANNKYVGEVNESVPITEDWYRIGGKNLNNQAAADNRPTVKVWGMGTYLEQSLAPSNIMKNTNINPLFNSNQQARLVYMTEVKVSGRWGWTMNSYPSAIYQDLREITDSAGEIAYEAYNCDFVAYGIRFGNDIFIGADGGGYVNGNNNGGKLDNTGSALYVRCAIGLKKASSNTLGGTSDEVISLSTAGNTVVSTSGTFAYQSVFGELASGDAKFYCDGVESIQDVRSVQSMISANLSSTNGQIAGGVQGLLVGGDLTCRSSLGYCNVICRGGFKGQSGTSWLTASYYEPNSMRTAGIVICSYLGAANIDNFVNVGSSNVNVRRVANLHQTSWSGFLNYYYNMGYWEEKSGLFDGYEYDYGFIANATQHGQSLFTSSQPSGWFSKVKNATFVSFAAGRMLTNQRAGSVAVAVTEGSTTLPTDTVPYVDDGDSMPVYYNVNDSRLQTSYYRWVEPARSFAVNKGATCDVATAVRPASIDLSAYVDMPEILYTAKDLAHIEVTVGNQGDNEDSINLPFNEIATYYSYADRTSENADMAQAAREAVVFAYAGTTPEISDGNVQTENLSIISAATIAEVRDIVANRDIISNVFLASLSEILCTQRLPQQTGKASVTVTQNTKHYKTKAVSANIAENITEPYEFRNPTGLYDNEEIIADSSKAADNEKVKQFLTGRTYLENTSVSSGRANYLISYKRPGNGATDEVPTDQRNAFHAADIQWIKDGSDHYSVMTITSSCMLPEELFNCGTYTLNWTEYDSTNSASSARTSYYKMLTIGNHTGLHKNSEDAEYFWDSSTNNAFFKFFEKLWTNLVNLFSADSVPDRLILDTQNHDMHIIIPEGCMISIEGTYTRFLIKGSGRVFFYMSNGTQFIVNENIVNGVSKPRSTQTVVGEVIDYNEDPLDFRQNVAVAYNHSYLDKDGNTCKCTQKPDVVDNNCPYHDYYHFYKDTQTHADGGKNLNDLSSNIRNGINYYFPVANTYESNSAGSYAYAQLYFMHMDPEATAKTPPVRVIINNCDFFGVVYMPYRFNGSIELRNCKNWSWSITWDGIWSGEYSWDDFKEDVAETVNVAVNWLKGTWTKIKDWFISTFIDGGHEPEPDPDPSETERPPAYCYGCLVSNEITFATDNYEYDSDGDGVKETHKFPTYVFVGQRADLKNVEYQFGFGETDYVLVANPLMMPENVLDEDIAQDTWGVRQVG